MKRFWEIDFFRGIAVILMVVFNYAFALQYLRVLYLDLGWAFWWLFPRLIAGMFIFIAGVSVSVSRSRLKNESAAKRKYILRGAKIFSLGLLITLATLVFVPSSFVVFGILHLLGSSIAVSPLFLRMRSRHLLIFAAGSLAAGVYLQTTAVSFPWLLWLGFVPEDFSTLDYFPLLPWLGIFLLGMAFGSRFYKNARRRFSMPEQPAASGVFCFLGRRSLWIYMAHVPLLVLVLSLLGAVFFI